VDNPVLSRVRETIARRRANGATVAMPQSLLGFDTDELEGLEYHPWRRVLGSRSEVDVRDIVEATLETLVRRCYRLLLLRDPNEGEAERCERMLARGWPPIVLVGLVRGSREGRALGVPVRGLAAGLVPGLVLSLVRRALAAFREAP
jgi:hypothetical protein